MERKSGCSKLFSYFGISAGNKKGPGILVPMKTFVQKTVFVQRPGIVPGKVDIRKGKTGGFGFVQRGNGFGKG